MTEQPEQPQGTPMPMAEALTAMAVGAAAMHEWWTTMVAAGFTGEQALYLLGQVLVANIRGAQG